MSGRKTVLIVDDDPGILYVLANGLSNMLDMYDVVTASNGREAIEVLEQRPIDVLVTDLAMPVLDGFALIAYVTNQRSTLPVVVLSGMATNSVDQRLSGYGGLRVLSKPASYQDVAQCVLEEIERVDMGQVEGIPLAGVLQLVEAERRSCTVVVSSGKRRGRLQFESGRLMNAFSEDFGAEGEAAAYDILSWGDTAIEFEHLPNTVRKLIHTPMQLMLIELAVVQDQIRGHQETVADEVADTGADTGADEVADTGADEVADTGADEGTDAGSDRGADRDAAAAEAFDAGATMNDAPLDHVADAPTEVPGASIDAGAAGTAGAEPTSTGADREAHPTSGPQAGERAADAAVPSTHLLQSGGAPMNEETPTDPNATIGVAHAGAAPRPSPVPARLDDDHVVAMVAAVERLAERARDADDALAAVSVEVDAFRAAQRRFDEVNAQRESRRHELESFREDVARLAREILGKVEGLFDGMASGPDADRDPEPRNRS